MALPDPRLNPISVLSSLLIGLAILTGAPAYASEPFAGDSTTTPYAALYAAFAAARGVEDHPRLRAVQRIESKLPGVRAQDIAVVIHGRAAPIRLVIGADGGVAFPLRDDLLAENPPVTSNQPRGSLTLSVTLALRTPSATRVPAAELRAALDAVDAWLAEQPAGKSRGRARGAAFRFPPGAGASITVRGASERFLLADAQGRIVLMRDPDLNHASDIELSQLPLEVLPWIAL